MISSWNFPSNWRWSLVQRIKIVTSMSGVRPNSTELCLKIRLLHTVPNVKGQKLFLINVIPPRPRENN